MTVRRWKLGDMAVSSSSACDDRRSRYADAAMPSTPHVFIRHRNARTQYRLPRRSCWWRGRVLRAHLIDTEILHYHTPSTQARR